MIVFMISPTFITNALLGTQLGSSNRGCKLLVSFISIYVKPPFSWFQVKSFQNSAGTNACYTRANSAPIYIFDTPSSTALSCSKTCLKVAPPGNWLNVISILIFKGFRNRNRKKGTRKSFSICDFYFLHFYLPSTCPRQPLHFFSWSCTSSRWLIIIIHHIF